jgi:hypothetical protein
VELAPGQSFRAIANKLPHREEYRCPTECQLSHSDGPWTCTISLQLNSAADGSLANSQKVQFGPPITEKSEVTERIRRAQRAILNPSQLPDVFLSGVDSGHEVPFSSNRIVVHVSGPDITDLNFIDLPGPCLVWKALSTVFNILSRSVRRRRGI